MEINYPLYENCSINFEQNSLLWILRNTGLFPYFLEAYEAQGLSENELKMDIDMDNSFLMTISTENRSEFVRLFSSRDSGVKIFQKTYEYNSDISLTLSAFRNIGIFPDAGFISYRTSVIELLSTAYRYNLHNRVDLYYQDGQNVTLSLHWIISAFNAIERDNLGVPSYNNLAQNFFSQFLHRRRGNASRFYRALLEPVNTIAGSSLNNMNGAMVDAGFSWSESAEGSNFWESVNSQFRERIQRFGLVSDNNVNEEDIRIASALDCWPLCKIGFNIVQEVDVNLTNASWVDELETVA